MTQAERREIVLSYVKEIKEWNTPAFPTELTDAVLGDPSYISFNIDEGPYFGQIFRCHRNVRKDWVASAAVYCCGGRHMVSGGVVLHTMRGLLSFPEFPAAWHIEYQPQHGLWDEITICRLIPE
jgi:hypothetical protein